MKNNTTIAALIPITIEEMIATQVMSTFAPICYSPRRLHESWNPYLATERTFCAVTPVTRLLAGVGSSQPAGLINRREFLVILASLLAWISRDGLTVQLILASNRPGLQTAAYLKLASR